MKERERGGGVRRKREAHFGSFLLLLASFRLLNGLRVRSFIVITISFTVSSAATVAAAVAKDGYMGDGMKSRGERSSLLGLNPEVRKHRYRRMKDSGSPRAPD